MTTIDAMAKVLLAHREPLTDGLLRQIATHHSGSAVTEALLARPELSDAVIDTIARRVSSKELLFASISTQAAILARQRFRTDDDMVSAFERVADANRGTKLETVVHLALKNPAVRDDVLDLMAESSNLVVLATYARYTPRGPSARAAALDRLEHALYPNVTRVPPAASTNAAEALLTLLNEAPDLGRDQYLRTRTRAVLIAVPEHHVMDLHRHLDTEMRAHLLRYGFLPTLMLPKVTQKDSSAISDLLRPMIADLDTDVLEKLAPLLGAHRGGDAVLRELKNRNPDSFDVSTKTLTSVASESGPYQQNAAAWLVEQLGQLSETIGWNATFVLASQLPDKPTFEQVRDLVVAVGSPAGAA